MAVVYIKEQGACIKKHSNRLIIEKDGGIASRTATDSSNRDFGDWQCADYNTGTSHNFASWCRCQLLFWIR